MASGPSMCAAKLRLTAGVIFVMTLFNASPAAAFLFCFVTSDNIAFGSYSAINPMTVDSTGNVSLTCFGNVTGNVNAAVSISTGDSGSFSPRAMANGANLLDYNLYANASRTIVWGDGGGGTVTQTLPCSMSGGGFFKTCSDSATMYARIPSSQNPPAGSYLDSLIVTVTY